MLNVDGTPVDVAAMYATPVLKGGARTPEADSTFNDVFANRTDDVLDKNSESRTWSRVSQTAFRSLEDSVTVRLPVDALFNKELVLQGTLGERRVQWTTETPGKTCRLRHFPPADTRMVRVQFCFLFGEGQ